jgi:alkylhydroperoxidase family enzyme
LLAYGEKLTREPAKISADDIERLRQAGHSDRAIHDAAQVISYFNYINRIADGLGVDLEDWMPPKR